MTCYWPRIRNTALAAIAVTALWHKTVLHVLSVVGMALGSVLAIAVTAVIVVGLNRVARTVQRRRAAVGGCTTCALKCQLAITAPPAPRRGLPLTPVASARSRTTASGAVPPVAGPGTADVPSGAVPPVAGHLMRDVPSGVAPSVASPPMWDVPSGVAPPEFGRGSAPVVSGEPAVAAAHEDLVMVGGLEYADGPADAVAGQREPVLAGRP
jgi:hypothetical protein